jgi:hypothetical protein
MGWIRRLPPFAQGVVGAALGTALVLLVLHGWQLYWALRQVIQFVNTYGPKIQALP